MDCAYTSQELGIKYYIDGMYTARYGTFLNSRKQEQHKNLNGFTYI
jgi:hypothetical protein